MIRNTIFNKSVPVQTSDKGACSKRHVHVILSEHNPVDISYPSSSAMSIFTPDPRLIYITTTRSICNPPHVHTPLVRAQPPRSVHPPVFLSLCHNHCWRSENLRSLSFLPLCAHCVLPTDSTRSQSAASRQSHNSRLRRQGTRRLRVAGNTGCIVRNRLLYPVKIKLYSL